MDVHFGIEGTNSNWHGEEIDKEVSLMKIIKNFQKDIQIHQVDNERIKRDKEQHEDFNMKLIRILEIIEKKLDKESGSIKLENNMSLDEERRGRSGSRHSHHSQKNSHRRAHSRSIPSPIRKHKRSGVDELKGEMNNIKPSTFDGEHKKDEYVETCLLGMRKYFQLQKYSSHAEGIISIYQLKGKASIWWDQMVQVQCLKEKNVTWKEFKKHFEKKYLAKR
jgi:hypothetical protein